MDRTAGGMPPTKVRKKTPPRRLGVGDLPDGALQRVLSLLPAQEAVRTCVLARRWCHTWKSAAGLIILCGGETRRKFADRLLRARGATPVDTCEFRLLELDKDDAHRIDLWIRHVLHCKVRVLRLNNVHIGWQPPHEYVPADLPLISQHLKKLQLENIPIHSNGFLEFSSCPVLEDLEIRNCDLFYADRLFSQSLKRLTIDRCIFCYDEPMEICAPNLVSLWLQDICILYGCILDFLGCPALEDLVICNCDLSVDQGCSTPSLQGTPSLVGAVIKVNNNDCGWGHAQYWPRTDLKFYPTFNKLKTLLLNEYWCEPPDFSALASILEHSPVLEKLTLQLYSEGRKHNVEIKLSCKPMEKSAAISEHLSVVEIKSEALDERVSNVLKFLGKLNIWFQFS
ncbi:unnamed protein product [Urochloa decumbens]|uniref:F-box domain-containing protein n=1 Tax=Urochloa decumbens TaxID=240449 RepID=A0ABC9B6R4_9POAL